MLIDFTVENYRSIKEPVTLSAVAQTRGKSRQTKRRPGVVPDDEIAPPFPVEGRGFELLPTLAIFGANASGKSNVLMALETLTSFMFNGDNTFEMQPFLSAFVPFALDEISRDAVTRCTLRTAFNGHIYTYVLAVDRTKIIEERLERIASTTKRAIPKCLFRRTLDDGEDNYTWTNGKDLGRDYVPIQQAMRHSEPFLAFLIGKFDLEITRALGGWLGSRWPGTVLGYEQLDHKHLIKWINDNPGWLADVGQLITRFDTGIHSLQMGRFAMPDDDNKYRIITEHLTLEGKTYLFPFEQESMGTQRLFTLGIRMLIALRNGSLLLVDELGSNIHPNITRDIVKLFQDPVTNPKRAQLIFTSHDNTLMRHNLLRRDQIWFTEKRRDGSTDLYSLADFRPRNDLALDSAYLDGRFGATPFLPEHTELVEFSKAA